LSPEPVKGHGVFFGLIYAVFAGWQRRNMGKRNHNQFIKRQKELERQRKATEKMAKRQGKNMRNGEVEAVVESASAEPAQAEAEA
jgi:hypothetical protein